MASLAVQKQQGNCILSVSVESLQAFSLDNYPLPFFDVKAIKLKNTGLGTVRGQRQAMCQLDNNIRDVSPIRKTEKLDSRTKALISTFAVGGPGILLVKSLQHRN
ncbi:uncharacterized protein LOC132058482 [Lycium ferocissimum]|uniref:uncharacterized protein LOC132058482 n=1 Tax=Lycium ferocissimum TaxID=112874 RepID=UPI0028157DBF|nr:uncharacterized protein LOC132058482 [Lycium ferocissimum]